MKKFVYLVVLLATLLTAREYNATTIRSISPYQREGILLDTDSILTSSALNVRGMSKIQLAVSGIDSTTIIVSFLIGGNDYLTPDARIGVLDTNKVEFDVDTLTANGLHTIDYMGTALKVRSTKKDNTVKVRFNISTY